VYPLQKPTNGLHHLAAPSDTHLRCFFLGLKNASETGSRAKRNNLAGWNRLLLFGVTE
jgi:hypothetical protein